MYPIILAAMMNELLEDIRVFIRDHKIAASTFGRLSVNDGKLVQRLESGGQVLPTTAERIRHFIKNYQ